MYSKPIPQFHILNIKNRILFKLNFQHNIYSFILNILVAELMSNSTITSRN